MANKKRETPEQEARQIALTVRRVRSRISASLQTGSAANSMCLTRSDPTAQWGGYACATGIQCTYKP
jgi:hypothetical protein